MKRLKITMMAAALMAAPTFAQAQFSVGSLTDSATDKATETVLKNATPADTLTAGSTLLRGGSKEDAAIAVVRGRAEQRVDGLTGGASTNSLSTNGLVGSSASIASSGLGNSAASSLVPQSSNSSILGQASGLIGSSGNAASPKLPKLGF